METRRKQAVQRRCSLWLHSDIDGQETMYKLIFKPADDFVSKMGRIITLFKYIEGAKTDKKYVVWHEDGCWHCSCPSFHRTQDGTQGCKHLIMLEKNWQLWRPRP